MSTIYKKNYFFPLTVKTSIFTLCNTLDPWRYDLNKW